MVGSQIPAAFLPCRSAGAATYPVGLHLTHPRLAHGGYHITDFAFNPRDENSLPHDFPQPLSPVAVASVETSFNRLQISPRRLASSLLTLWLLATLSGAG